MKNILTKIILLSILGLQFCSPKLQVSTYSGEVNYIGKDASGTINLRAVGYGNNVENAVSDAKLNAINILLFKGLPGSEINVPLVDNEFEAKKRNQNYFDRLLTGGYYSSYVMTSSLNSNAIKVKGTYRVTLDLKINYNSLRIDLEQNNIIRKFGY